MVSAAGLRKPLIEDVSQPCSSCPEKKSSQPAASDSVSTCPFLLLPVETGAGFCSSQGFWIRSVQVLHEQTHGFTFFPKRRNSDPSNARECGERKKKKKNPTLATEDELSLFTGKKSNGMMCLRISSEFVATPYISSMPELQDYPSPMLAVVLI